MTAAIRLALQKAHELGATAMDWLGTGSNQRYADKMQRQYLTIIEAGQRELTGLLPQRMWIDQPSTLQPHHALHGTNVLAVPESANTMRVYFLTGDVISQNMVAQALSPGWQPTASKGE